MKKTEQPAERLELKIPTAALVRVDDWRRAQADLPTRSEAIRRLIDAGIDASRVDA